MVRVGELLDLTARVIRTGRSSMMVSVKGSVRPIGTNTERPALSGQFEMVAVGMDGRPRLIAQKTCNEGTDNDHA